MITGATRIGMRFALPIAAALLCCAAVEGAPFPKGKRIRINHTTVLHVAGMPEEMGEQHGRLMRREVRRMIGDLIHPKEEGEAHRNLISGARAMERFQPEAFLRELRALAKAADVSYDDLLAAQLFGDVARAQYCTSYAVVGPATRTGECIVGRNMDYWDSGVSSYAAILLHASPTGGLPFVTVTWAGIINGWTAMNSAGLVSANNSAYGALSESLEGISTCFLLRKVVQHARTVAEGVRIVEAGPRACGTSLIIAGGTPPDAAILEFDHEKVAVRRPERGYVLADNGLRALYRDGEPPLDWEGSRYSVLRGLIEQNHGRIERGMNFAGAPGVPITSMNLHSALLFPADLRFRVSMGRIPACEHPYRAFRMTDRGIVSDE